MDWAERKSRLRADESKDFESRNSIYLASDDNGTFTEEFIYYEYNYFLLL